MRRHVIVAITMIAALAGFCGQSRADDTYENFTLTSVGYDWQNHVGVPQEQVCRSYANDMARLAQMNSTYGCAYTGGLWSDPQAAYDACMGLDYMQAVAGPGWAADDIDICRICRMEQARLKAAIASGAKWGCFWAKYSPNNSSLNLPIPEYASEQGVQKYCIHHDPLSPDGIHYVFGIDFYVQDTRACVVSAEIRQAMNQVYSPGVSANVGMVATSSGSSDSSIARAKSSADVSMAWAKGSVDLSMAWAKGSSAVLMAWAKGSSNPPTGMGAGKTTVILPAVDDEPGWLRIGAHSIRTEGRFADPCGPRFKSCEPHTVQTAFALAQSSDKVKDSLLWRFGAYAALSKFSATSAALVAPPPTKLGVPLKADQPKTVAPKKIEPKKDELRGKEKQETAKKHPGDPISPKPVEAKSVKVQASKPAAASGARPPSGGLLDDDAGGGGGGRVSGSSGGGGGVGNANAGGHRWRP